MTGDVEGADNTVLGTQLGAVNGANCLTDFVVIPNPTVAATALAAGTDRFCGLGFVPVQSKHSSLTIWIILFIRAYSIIAVPTYLLKLYS